MTSWGIPWDHSVLYIVAGSLLGQDTPGTGIFKSTNLAGMVESSFLVGFSLLFYQEVR